MIDKILAVSVVTLLLMGCFVIAYLGAFYVTLSDDIEVNRGKKALKNKRKQYKGFWKKFFFLDFKEHIKKWHYFLFICFLVLFPVTLIFIDLLILFDKSIFRVLMLIFGIPCVATILISSFSRWSLYRGNIIRRRPPKKK